MYKLHLILKYLRKRRIAWVSLIAVMLCTAMVLVVISVMGGWLRMFRESFKGVSGDVLVESRTLSGFPYYQEMIDRIDKLPGVEASAPILRTFGLVKVGPLDPQGVQVVGYPIEKIGRVNNFPQSLYRQYYGILEARERLKSGEKLSDEKREELEALAKQDIKPPSFNQFLSPDQYELANVDERTDPKTNPGMIVGVGVVGIHKDPHGTYTTDRFSRMYRIPSSLTVMDMNGKGPITEQRARTTGYWIVDDSRTKVYQVDENTVYVPFKQLQKDLGLTARTVTRDNGRVDTLPAKTSEIHVRIKPGADADAVRDQVEKIVQEVSDQQAHAAGTFAMEVPEVWTWDKKPGTAKFLSAVEKEMVLVTLLFSLISVVAVFLIFCIFYMIVVEKTRDIGIVKSVGASAGGVAQIFLGYGLAIGLLGGGLGLAAGYVIVKNINQLHTWMGKVMGIQMWDAETYAFDTIPNTINPRHVAVIVSVAVFASVLGALVPAFRAARMHPVEALRWE
jgi:lipoprotein-releasing system permease protein